MISIILNEIAWNEVENMKIHYTWLVNSMSPWRHGMAPKCGSDVVTDDATPARSMKKYITHIIGFLGKVEQFEVG